MRIYCDEGVCVSPVFRRQRSVEIFAQTIVPRNCWLGRCFSQASKLFEICQRPLLQVSFQNDALSQVMLWPYLPRGYTATQRNSRRPRNGSTVCRPIPAGRPLRPFADLIYGAILMPKNIPHAPSACPASRFQAVSGLSRSSRSRFLVLYRSFARPCRGGAYASISRARTPTERVSLSSDGLLLKNSRWSCAPV